MDTSVNIAYISTNNNGGGSTASNLLSFIGSLPEFSTTENYTIGDYVAYQNKMYVFTSAHTAGAWNSAHVEETSIINELVKLNRE